MDKDLRSLSPEEAASCRKLLKEIQSLTGESPSLQKLAGYTTSSLDDFDMLEGIHEAVLEHSSMLENELSNKNEEVEGLLAKMKKYLSPQLFNLVVGGDVNTDTNAHQRKEMPVFFSDIVGFTDLTDKIEPETRSALLNSYLNKMTLIASKWGGTIDKFIGDAVMIFFNDNDVSKSVNACVQMAMEMQDSMHQLRKEWSDKGMPSGLKIRVGINTGYCTIGNFGSDERMDYTIVGGTVNTASRLEGQSEPGGILISASTYGYVKELIKVESKGLIKVKGVAHPVETFQIIGLLGSKQNPSLITLSENGFHLNEIHYTDESMSSLEKETILLSLNKAIEVLKNK